MQHPGRRAVTVSRKSFEGLIVLAIILTAGAIRAVAYGDLRLSIGNAETGRYVASSRVSLFSWQAFAGQRLFTTNLIYKLANDPVQCKLVAVSNPAGGSHIRPIVQACFENIALLQNVLAIIAWCLLAWVTACWMTTFPAKVGVAGVILLFGFTPQIAEWDSILSPESLTVTGYVGLLALLEEVVLRVVSGREWLGARRHTWLVAAWLLLFALWVFLRDVHLYAVPVTLLMVALLLFSHEVRKRSIVWIALGMLLAVFVLGYISAADSLRATHFPLAHAFEDYILPFPDRTAFFKRLGMPDRTASTYQQWLDNNAVRTYGAFLVTHPGYVLTSITKNIYYFRAEFVQQYFQPKPPSNRALLLQLGETLHPETMAIYLLDILCIAGLWLAAMRGSAPLLGGWAWITTWFFLTSAAVLFVGFFGDAEAARRHIYPSVEAFRLLTWLLLFLYLDRLLLAAPVREEVRGTADAAT